MSRQRSVAIVGGGILGSVLALRLAEAGARVTLLERAPSFGGLAGAMELGGHRVDRFYHVITPADTRMLGMAEELGLADELRFREVSAGFFIDGELHDFDGVGDLLRFSPLSALQRLRLAWFVGQCQLRRSPGRLDDLPLERWLRRHCGRGLTDKLWRPLLDSRFERDPSGLPATYLWARTRRMSGARERGAGGEQFGHLRGGHQRLIDAIIERACELGVEARAGVPVEGLVCENGEVTGVQVGGERERYDLTISTLQPPALARLLPGALERLLEPYPKRWLGVVCLAMTVKRELLPYYAVNICEPTPITTVVESSHVVGTEHLGGLRLLYLPRYCAPDAPEQSEDDGSVYERFTAQLRRMAPSFSDDDVVDWTVQRARLVEPVHPLGAGSRIAPIWPGVPGLALASNAQIYPWLLNGDSVIRFAEGVATEAAARLEDGWQTLPSTTLRTGSSTMSSSEPASSSTRSSISTAAG
jgi:protoporphyrinogen oxidase